MSFLQPAGKTNRVLHIVLVSFLLIAFRIWHLGVVQRDDKLQEVQRPKLRSILLRADRGPICDRFHIPLAVNRICYNAAVYYGQIAQIPIIGWKTDGEGKRVRIFPRREHIRQLSQALGETLGLEPSRIEDLIHAKASLLPHIPYILKANLSESEYYRLKLLEKDWLGAHAEISSERHYPYGKAGCHLIGTLGSISHRQYAAIGQEMSALQEAIDTFENQGPGGTLPEGYASFEAVYERLHELKERAYTLNDKVGMSGVEGAFEESLRGFWGLKTFEVDQKGKALREMPGGKPPIPGKEVVLTISAELQQFAEELLILSERDREGRSFAIDPVDKVRKSQKQPWIKGGAIIALDPETGELLAFASHPRFDPNDFVGSAKPSKQSALLHWLENERLVAAAWDGRELLSRERPSGRKIAEEKIALSWEFVLEQLLPPEGPLRQFFSRFDDVKTAVHMQEDLEALLYFSHKKADELIKDWESLKTIVEAAPHLRRLEAHLGAIPSIADRFFAIDLCRLAVHSPRFSDDLVSKVGSMKIGAYRTLEQAFHRFERKIREEARESFHLREFPVWREAHQKEFLSEKRKEEKEKKTYARPYIDYLDQKEKELFQAYWEENKIKILLEKLHRPIPDPDRELLQKTTASLPEDLAEEWLKTFRSFSELDRPLSSKKGQTEKDLAAAVYPRGGFGFGRSYAYQTETPQGSIFKLIVAYEGLRQGAHLTLIDEAGIDPNAPPGKNQIVAYSTNRTPYPRIYKGGRLPKTSAANVGKIDLIGAIEHSSNPYFSLLAAEHFKNPEDLNDAARLFGFGAKSGIELIGEAKGNLPSDLKTNRTGLYSYAIGQHTLLSTPLQTALMLGTLANGGRLLKPKIVKEASGLALAKEPFSQENRFARNELDALGIPFPLFTAAQSRTPQPNASEPPQEITRMVFLPPSIRNPILEGMDKSVWSGKGSVRPTNIRALLGNPLLMRDFLSLQHQMIAKTGTAEILYNPNANPSSLARMYKHTWFGAISFPSDGANSKARWDSPELVVVILTRFGDAGKEGAPIAAQLIRKWREIKKKQGI